MRRCGSGSVRCPHAACVPAVPLPTTTPHTHTHTYRRTQEQATSDKRGVTHLATRRSVSHIQAQSLKHTHTQEQCARVHLLWVVAIVGQESGHVIHDFKSSPARVHSLLARCAVCAPHPSSM
jgi:hypothetical protein